MDCLHGPLAWRTKSTRAAQAGGIPMLLVDITAQQVTAVLDPYVNPINCRFIACGQKNIKNRGLLIRISTQHLGLCGKPRKT